MEKTLVDCFLNTSVELELYGAVGLSRLLLDFASWLRDDVALIVTWTPPEHLTEELQIIAADVRDHITMYLNRRPNSVHFGGLARLRDWLCFAQNPNPVIYGHLGQGLLEIPAVPGKLPPEPAFVALRRQRFNIRFPEVDGIPPGQTFTVAVKSPPEPKPVTWLPKNGNHPDLQAPAAKLSPMQIPPQARYIDGPEIAKAEWEFKSKQCHFAADMLLPLRTAPPKGITPDHGTMLLQPAQTHLELNSVQQALEVESLPQVATVQGDPNSDPPPYQSPSAFDFSTLEPLLFEFVGSEFSNPRFEFVE